MAHTVYPVNDPARYRVAGPTDIVKMKSPPGSNSQFFEKWRIEMLFTGIINNEFVHLSGPTGTSKTSLLEALYLVPENFNALCKALGYKVKPLVMYPIEMVIFDTPGELVQRRGLENGSTFDELSVLATALIETSESGDGCYQSIWLREMGRVHSASIQGGLLNLMTKTEIMLPNGRHINGNDISWVADSNYQAENDSTHTLVTLDDALKRRFTVNLTLNYPPADHEVTILQHIMREQGLPEIDEEHIKKIVKLGQVIRRHRNEGNLLSIAPPTIYGYMSFLRMSHRLSHLSPQQIATGTILGNASDEDQKMVAGVFNEVFGLQAEFDEDPTEGGNLF